MATLADRLKSIWLKISKPVKVAFFAALIAGFIAHLPAMTNHFFNHDSLLYTLIDQDSTFSLQQGKWLFLITKRLIQGDLTTAGIIIPLALFFLALTASLTVSVLKIRSSLWAALTGCFIVLFPSVFCANIYMASAVFFFALLVATFAVFFTDRWRHGYLLAILLLTLSCGIYSVFIGYAAGLYIMILLLGLLDHTLQMKDALLKGLKYVCILALSALLYFLILKLVLNIDQIALMNYRGISSVGKASVAAVFADAMESYRKVLYFFVYGIFLYRGNFRIEPLFLYLNWVTLFLAAAFSFWCVLKNRIYRNPLQVLMVLALTLIFPFAIHAIGILGQNAYTHWIMIYPFVLVYVFMLSVADRAEYSIHTETDGQTIIKAGVRRVLRIGTICALIVGVLLSRQWFFTANQSYEYMRYADATTNTAGVMLVNDIQNAEDYDPNTPVVFAGSGAPAAFQYDTQDFAAVKGTNGPGYTGVNKPIIDNTRLQVFLRNWIGVSFDYANSETAARISGTDQVASMPIYPAKGSIQKIDGCLVVKLSEIVPAE